MSEHARDQQPDAYNKSEQNLDASHGVAGLSKVWQKFEITFRGMLEKLAPTMRKNVKGDDLQLFLRDLEIFYNYIEDLKTSNVKYEDIINNIDKLSNDIMNIVDTVVPASMVQDRYNESGWSLEQLAENDDAYSKRLSRLYILVRRLLKDFFDKKS